MRINVKNPTLLEHIKIPHLGVEEFTMGKKIKKTILDEKIEYEKWGRPMENIWQKRTFRLDWPTSVFKISLLHTKISLTNQSNYANGKWALYPILEHKRILNVHFQLFRSWKTQSTFNSSSRLQISSPTKFIVAGFSWLQAFDWNFGPMTPLVLLMTCVVDTILGK